MKEKIHTPAFLPVGFVIMALMIYESFLQRISPGGTGLGMLAAAAAGAAVAGAGIGGLRYVTSVEPANVEVKEVRLTLPHLTPAFNGLRLVQISDIHLGGWMNRQRLDRVVQLALDQPADVYLLTGDYLIGYGWSPERAALLDEMAESLTPLSQAAPVLGILGNHDVRSSARAVRDMFTRAGVVDLSNTVYTLRRSAPSGEAEQFHIAGVDDYYTGKARLKRVLRRLPETGGAILLAHEPDYADISAATGRFDLQVSGHTHGGQIVLPGGAPFALPRYGRKYPSGLYRVGEMWQYTNRGVGMGRFAVRFNCRPEISVFVLEKA